MGTYTTNKELFMPTVGEQGWGELVNGNFSTIDTFLKPITVSGSTYTFTGNHVGNQSGGTINATSISNSGTFTQTGTSTFTGKITANGGVNNYESRLTSLENISTTITTGIKYQYKVQPTSSTSTFSNKIGDSVTIACVPFGSIITGTVSATISGDYNGASLVFFKNDGTISTANPATNVSIPSNTYLIILNGNARYANTWFSFTLYGIKLVSITPI